LDTKKVQGGHLEPKVASKVLKVVTVTGISVPTIFDITMLDDDDYDDVDTVKVLILYESNLVTFSRTQTKGTSMETNEIEKVTTPEEHKSQTPKEENTQESDGGNENAEKGS
jgi:hypothetical protein